MSGQDTAAGDAKGNAAGDAKGNAADDAKDKILSDLTSEVSRLQTALTDRQTALTLCHEIITEHADKASEKQEAQDEKDQLDAIQHLEDLVQAYKLGVGTICEHHQWHTMDACDPEQLGRIVRGLMKGTEEQGAVAAKTKLREMRAIFFQSPVVTVADAASADIAAPAGAGAAAQQKVAASAESVINAMQRAQGDDLVVTNSTASIQFAEGYKLGMSTPQHAKTFEDACHMDPVVLGCSEGRHAGGQAQVRTGGRGRDQALQRGKVKPLLCV